MTPIQEVLYGKLRRASHVWRFSAQPMIQRENVAEHSFWTAIIAVTIAYEIESKVDQPNLAAEVALRSILHDIEETMTGDLVRSMKYFNVATRQAIAKVEDEFAAVLFNGLGETGGKMMHIWTTAKDVSLAGQVVALADLLCVLASCAQEFSFGNTHGAVVDISSDCKALIVKKFRDNETLWPIAEEAMIYA